MNRLEWKQYWREQRLNSRPEIWKPVERLLVDLLGRINLLFNFYINCPITTVHTAKKLLLITDTELITFVSDELLYCH